MTDPNDDGLRMPIPPASLKIKKPKKKKKWSIILNVLFMLISSSKITDTWSCIMTFGLMFFKEELPIIRTIINIYLLSWMDISTSHQKCFISINQFNHSITSKTFIHIHFSQFPVSLIFLTKIILWLPFNDIIGLGSRRATNHTIFVIQNNHFIFH